MTWRREGALIRAVLLVFLGTAGASAAEAQSVTTYHYDNYRTGWNSNETILTPANVKSTANQFHKQFLMQQHLPSD